MGTALCVTFATGLGADEIPEYLAKLSVNRWNPNSVFGLNKNQNVDQLQLLHLQYSAIGYSMVNSQYIDQIGSLSFMPCRFHMLLFQLDYSHLQSKLGMNLHGF